MDGRLLNWKDKNLSVLTRPLWNWEDIFIEIKSFRFTWNRQLDLTFNLNSILYFYK